MKNLLWFHVFAEGLAPSEFLPILQERIEPRRVGSTAANEDALNIAPNCVYFYLGQMLEDFGPVGFGLPLDALQGQMSPFDSGGLVKHHLPVRDWASAEKIDYLDAATWSTDDALRVLTDYPGSALTPYLKGDRPQEAGPHEVWPGQVPSAELWQSNTHWRSWVWEARVPNKQLLDQLKVWTCPPGDFPEVRRILRSSTSRATALSLLSKYRHGGVSVLLNELLPEQATP